MENNDKKLFRAALNGFNKTDVMEYIDDLTQDYERREKEIAQKTELLEKEKESQSQQIKELMQKLDDTLARVMEADKKAETLEQEISELKETNKQLEEKNTVLDFSEKEKVSKIEQLTDSEAKLKAKVSELDALTAEFQEKAKAYDNIGRQAGDVMLKARQSADLMIGDAIFRSNNIKEETKDYINQLKQSLGSFKLKAISTKDILLKSLKELEDDTESYFTSLNDMDSYISSLEGDDDGNEEQKAVDEEKSENTSEKTEGAITESSPKNVILDKILSDIAKKHIFNSDK